MKEIELQDDWQIQEINEAIREADAGDFATKAEVRAVFNRWKVTEQSKNSHGHVTKVAPRHTL